MSQTRQAAHGSMARGGTCDRAVDCRSALRPSLGSLSQFVRLCSDLIAESLVHILVHQRGLADTTTHDHTERARRRERDASQWTRSSSRGDGKRASARGEVRRIVSAMIASPLLTPLPPPPPSCCLCACGRHLRLFFASAAAPLRGCRCVLLLLSSVVRSDFESPRMMTLRRIFLRCDMAGEREERGAESEGEEAKESQVSLSLPF